MRIQELLDTEEKKNWNKAGRLRKTSFLYYLINKGRIYYEGDKINLCNQLDSMITVLNEVYRDNWDFYLYDNTLQLITSTARHVNTWTIYTQYRTHNSSH